MSKDIIEIDKIFLQKIAEFTNIVLNELKELRAQVNNNLQKEAGVNEQREKYRLSVQKVAKALYNSDLDFITGDFDHRRFIKMATEDPSYMARMFEKVCNAADVSSLGKLSNVVVNKQASINDPVYLRAFGSRASAEEFLNWED